MQSRLFATYMQIVGLRPVVCAAIEPQPDLDYPEQARILSLILICPCLLLKVRKSSADLSDGIPFMIEHASRMQ